MDGNVNKSVAALAGAHNNVKTDVVFLKTVEITVTNKNNVSVILDGGELIRADPFMDPFCAVQIKDWIFFIDIPTPAARILKPDLPHDVGYVSGYYRGRLFVFRDVEVKDDPRSLYLSWIVQNILPILSP